LTSIDQDRRRVLQGLLAAGAGLAGWLPRSAAGAAPRLEFGPERPFSFAALIERARELADQPYREPRSPGADVVTEIDYDQHGQIRHRPELALWADGPGAFPATFFHLGKWFRQPVHLYTLAGGRAREIRYRRDYFSIPPDNPAQRMPDDAGFAGFRFHESRARADWRTQDWVAFLGASYFRAIGALGQYGLSARGVAIDTAVVGPEEFPQFREFYLEPTPTPDAPVLVHALLEGPGICGAYRFELLRREGVVMEVECHLFLRRDLLRLGIAPLTSMFWYSEQGRGRELDWRPEIHDSDGLAIWNGAGERIWRPLRNPPFPTASSFLDFNPRGFGLLQRDRDFEHYLDGVRYDLRPSLWIEPLEAWGEGSVQLVELATDDEIHDNMVAMWVPAGAARRGNRYRYRYRMHWLADEPYPARDLARVIATRSGRGGEPGTIRKPGQVRYVVEFAGPVLAGLDPQAEVAAVVSSSTGAERILLARAEPVPAVQARWRALFDLAVEPGEVADLRLYLRHNDRALSETWLFQHLSPAG
jgi:periplasmic glucans biosynthesis protein